MIALIILFIVIVVTYVNSSDRNRAGNVFGVVVLGGFLCAFINFALANAMAETEKTLVPITSPIVREIVNNEVVLSFTTGPDDRQWSLPGDTLTEVGSENSLVNNHMVTPSIWVSLMEPTLPDYKTLVVAP